MEYVKGGGRGCAEENRVRNSLERSMRPHIHQSTYQVQPPGPNAEGMHEGEERMEGGCVHDLSVWCFQQQEGFTIKYWRVAKNSGHSL